MRSLIFALAVAAASPALATEPHPHMISTKEGCREQLSFALRGAMGGGGSPHTEHAELVPEAGRDAARQFAEIQGEIADLREEAAQALMHACAAYD